MEDPEEEEVYTNIRQILGYAIGKTIIDITQHDRDEFNETKQSYVTIMLEDGNWIKFIVDEFEHTGGDPSES